MTRFSKLLQSAVDIPVLATTALGMALLAIGIGFITPTGEQSKLQYPPDLWCVSNYIEQRPQELLPDGRPRQDKLLDGKEDWIVRDQVKAPTKEEAEKIAQTNGKGRFEPSNQDELRTKLQANDKDFFTSHFNTGATIAGPCWGTGSTVSQTGRWLNDAINEQCGFNTASGYETVPGKPTQAVITAYSPNIPSIGNICDAKSGGQNATADNGSFKVIDGRLRYVKGSTVEDYVFAQPTDDPIIDWDKIEDQAVILEGFNNNQPIHIRDHYESGNHEGQNYLDLFLPCGSEYSGFVQSKTRKITVVDLTKPKPQVSTTTQTLPDGTPCPTQALPNGPSAGQDYRAQIALEFEKQYSILTETDKGTEFSASSGPLPQPSNKVAQVALSQVGYQGSPSSDGKRDCTKYDGCAQWCALFVTWVYREAGYYVPAITGAQNTFKWFQRNHFIFKDPSQAAEGDVVAWYNGGVKGHIGIVVANDPSSQTMKIVEGNTSSDRVKLYSYSYEGVLTKQQGLIGFGRW